MPEEKKTKNLHKGHRERLRKKFMNDDSDILEGHELLELLLFYVNPQKNTNGIARDLIRKFGNVFNVFEAEESDLLQVDGIGPQAAAFLKLQAKLLRRYNIEKENARTGMKITPRNAGKYIINYFSGYKNEVLMLFALDAECNLITTVQLAKGTIDKVQLFIRDIVQKAMGTQARYVIIAHNHPSGTLRASENDVRFTLELEKALAFVDIRLVDHIIVANENYLSLAMEYNVFDFD